MNIQSAATSHFTRIFSLLQQYQLPTDDIFPEQMPFWVAVDGETVVGAIGLEPYGADALIRSMVVHPGYRGRQIATALLQKAEAHAKQQGVQSLFLLTETAAGFFEKNNYLHMDRMAAPDAIQQTSQFRFACPASAQLLKKQL